MPVTSRTPVRPPPARARTLCPPLPDPLGRCANPAARGAPPPGGPSQGERTPTSLDHMGCGGRVDRGRGRRGELPRLHTGAGEKMPPTPLVRPLHSSSPDPAARIRDGNSRLPGSAPFFQPPRRNLGQGRRDQIQSLALLGQPPRPPRIAGLQDCGDSPAQTPATSFIFLSRWKFSLAVAPHRHVLRGSPPLPGRGLGYSGIHSTPKRYQICCGSLRNGLFGKDQHQPNPLSLRPRSSCPHKPLNQGEGLDISVCGPLKTSAPV
ncbi:uncharacterized protein LOC117202104 isoform X2 [Orcinus orca]|uniref:uncharacterized protein LOC117202104 isoform X2 n=1 Tax=Orcinus orca TaxID=9733 RepID=UPI001442201D|nr:uncharacterized protein LOC117202104 isoform X2 [Orcinus orca]